MDYLDVEQGRAAKGLRLVLCAGTPGVWGEALKAVLAYKSLDYVPVAQDVGGENAALRDWTGQTSAPVLVPDEGSPRCTWESQLWLAETLAPEPGLIPEDAGQRALMFGLLREIAGENGFGWCRRLQSLAASGGPEAAPVLQRLAGKYGYSQQALAFAAGAVPGILSALDAQLQHSGGPYLLGRALTAVDFYAAVFLGVMLDPMDDSVIPMPEGMRFGFTAGAEQLLGALTDRLRDHRELLFSEHIPTPLDF